MKWLMNFLVFFESSRQTFKLVIGLKIVIEFANNFIPERKFRET